MIYQLTCALLLGMTAASLVTVFRAVPPGKQLAATGNKPWACDTCMSFWTTGLVTLGAVFCHLFSYLDAWLAAPAYIVCLWLLKQTGEIAFPPGTAETGKKEENDA